MKITRITSFQGERVHLVRVETDGGITGWGECSPMDPATTAALVSRRIAPPLIGRDPFDGEALEEAAVTRNYKIAGQLVAMAWSGVEIALWDIKGRATGLPVHKLLGGLYRPRVPMYGSSMSRDLGAAEEAAKILAGVERFGFEAVKIKAGPRYGSPRGPVSLEADVAKVRTVREAVGPRCRIMVDGNGAFTLAQALMFWDAIRGFDIYHYEEPCPYTDVEAYRSLARAVPVPINVGEQDWNLHTFRDFIATGACGVAAADLTKCGGFAQGRRVAALCRAFDIVYSPHNTGRGVGLAAHLQLIASTPECAHYHEYSLEKGGASQRFLARPFEPVAGELEVPAGPGLGIDLDVQRIERELQRVD
jgi:L-alanine-DL-glutamate epimerase-like enolase superfamily enzyme